MADKPDHSNIPRLPDGVSAVRLMMSEAAGTEYRSCADLEEARSRTDMVAVMEGDYGGQIYLTCPVRHIRCDQTALIHLLADLDALGWHDDAGARLVFEPFPVGSGVAGGMGGGIVTDGFWLHPWFDQAELPSGLTRPQLLDQINAVIEGRAARIGTAP